LNWLSPTLGWIGFIATAWCAYFFRDPPRVTPLRDGIIVSPADGVVSAIGFYLPPPELGMGAEPLQRISVFMSVFDVHVNRAPVSGRVMKIAYKPGLFLNADLDKARTMSAMDSSSNPNSAASALCRSPASSRAASSVSFARAKTLASAIALA
jgi:phosphatidylserine decarboxylase precursor-related protein